MKSEVMQRPARRVALATTAVLALAAASAAGAQELSYTYAEIAYVTTDIDGVGKDVEGFALRGSFEIADNAFLYARYVDQGVTIGGFDIDAKQYALGGGLAWSFADNMDLYGRLGYTEVEFDVSGNEFFSGSGDDDGFEVGVGIRARPVDALELEGAVHYVDLSDSGDDTSFGLAGRWFFAPAFALGVEAEFADEADTYGVGFRWQFGN